MPPAGLFSARVGVWKDTMPTPVSSTLINRRSGRVSLARDTLVLHNTEKESTRSW